MNPSVFLYKKQSELEAEPQPGSDDLEVLDTDTQAIGCDTGTRPGESEGMEADDVAGAATTDSHRGNTDGKGKKTFAGKNEMRRLEEGVQVRGQLMGQLCLAQGKPVDIQCHPEL